MCQLMPSLEQFKDDISNAYRHLYDMVRLRTDPLIETLVRDANLQPTERAWRLHHLLLEAIENLNPGGSAPVNSKAWRRHRLMWLRYVEALEPQMVASQIAISRRQFYREHNEALDYLSEALFASIEGNRAQAIPGSDVENDGAEYLTLLRMEASRVNQSQRFVDPAGAINESLGLLTEMLTQRGISIERQLDDYLPPVTVDRGLLRQLLLGMMSLVATPSTVRTLVVMAGVNIENVVIATDSRSGTTEPVSEALLGQIDALEELARITSVHLSRNADTRNPLSLTVSLPIGRQHTILVVDDNADMLSLYRRYLTPHNYHVVTEDSAHNVYSIIRELRPFAVILDLMMPDQDGWDVIQSLTSSPETQHIPIVICSVLKQRELALSLGASAFLEKPITKDRLLQTLESLAQISG